MITRADIDVTAEDDMVVERRRISAARHLLFSITRNDKERTGEEVILYQHLAKPHPERIPGQVT